MKNKKLFETREIVLCGLFSALIASGAFIRIPLPFMDYFTLQFLFVILAGMILGTKLGAISVSIYVAIGLVGFPIFAAGGGPQYIFRPSFGYLLGFIAAAYVIGMVCSKFKNPTVKQYLLSAFSGFLIVYIIGLTYKYCILNFYLSTTTSLSALILLCFPLDIPGDIALCFASALLAKRLVPIVKRG